jgi:hypothetical protein
MTASGERPTEVGGTVAILAEVAVERRFQDAKWGFPQQVCGRPVTPMEWGGILAEEVGELCKELNDLQLEVPTARLSKARAEAVQVAAVAVSIVAHLEAYGWDGGPDA